MTCLQYLLSIFLFVLQPSEMSLEEIEEKISSIIQADTITQLKSAVWKERLEGILLVHVLILFLNQLVFLQLNKSFARV